MADFSTNGQDLTKALDNVASNATATNPAYALNPVATLAPAPQPVAPAVPVAPALAPAPTAYPPIIPQQQPLAAAPAPDSVAAPTQDVPAAPSAPNALSAYASLADGDGSANNAQPAAPSVNPVISGPLNDIKKEALDQLRPLVGKLSVEPQEKFDTYLLLIRSTDDTNLIAPAYDAAKAIPDESRRAEALLDIIKEIDYLSHPKS